MLPNQNHSPNVMIFFFPILFFQSLAIFPEWWTFQTTQAIVPFFSHFVLPRGYLVGTCRVPEEMCLEIKMHDNFSGV
jgi:hypothetical protein